ncbi:MAG: hypothetical protein DI533_22145 [Cereibacter sphaeroides]|uniref:Uncharacterized protein n=1 Tax=Cereibacter sphaeroides TaxID=1063 RepID=A0A2W5RVJ1_CERSP|nr:MAG: hypothetical protein DI533_22145 [Cereibacter sphaeroides]
MSRMQTRHPRIRFEKHDFKPALLKAGLPGNGVTVSLSSSRDQFMIVTQSILKENNSTNF